MITRELLTQFNILDITLILFYVLMIFVLSKSLINFNRQYFSLFLKIGFLHLFMTFVYYFYALNNVADAQGYYRNVMFVYNSWAETFGQSTNFIYFLLFPLVRIVGFSYFGSYFVFSLFGLFGFYLLLRVLINITNYKFTNYFYLLLLPNFHFWTVAIGKDSLIFFALSYILYNFFYKKKIRSYIIPILLVGFIRIHILVFLMTAYLIAQLFFHKKIKKSTKFLLVAIIISIIYIILPLVLENIGIRDGTTIEEQYKYLEGLKMEGGSSIDMTGKSIFIKWPSYVLRPAFFDVKDVLTFIASLENFVWLLIFIKIFRNRKNKIIEKYKYYYIFSLLVVFTITLPSSVILVNLGIAMRQKYMIFSFLLVALFISEFGKVNYKGRRIV